MKFISKFGNLQIVLKPGLPDAPLAGKLGEPGIYARFEEGLLETHDEDKIKMLLKHKDFGSDFVVLEEGLTAPTRPGLEPEHDMLNVDYGHLGKNMNPKAAKLSPEMLKMVTEMAAQLATEAFSKMVTDAKETKEVSEEKDIPQVETTEAPDKSPVQNTKDKKSTK